MRHDGTAAVSTEPAQAIDRIVTVRELRTRTTLSRSTIWRMTRDGELPRPVRLTTHRIGWRERDITAWLAKRTEAA